MNGPGWALPRSSEGTDWAKLAAALVALVGLVTGGSGVYQQQQAGAAIDAAGATLEHVTAGYALALAEARARADAAEGLVEAQRARLWECLAE